MSPIPTGRALLDPKKIFEKSGLKSGMHYADLGAGTLGHFVFPASGMVGDDGFVYAVDILKSALAAIKSRIKMENITNMKTVWADIERKNGVDIPDDELDMASVINIAGLIKKSPSVLEEAKRILKSDGTLLVIGWKPAGAPFGPDPEKRVSADEIRPIAEKKQFVHTETFEAGPYHWGLVFQNKE